jgi:hypothetical protein
MSATSGEYRTASSADSTTFQLPEVALAAVHIEQAAEKP